jgi:UDPglucose 6-dehydrogenase
MTDVHAHRQILVIGAGYVGLVTAVGLARLGHSVDLVETRPDRLAALRDGRVPIHEPGLQQAFEEVIREGRLTVHGVPPATRPDVAMVCVGTPIGDSGRADLSSLHAAVSELRPLLEAGTVVAIRSTLPVGSSHVVADWAGSTRRVFSNPEFLAQGRAYEDFLHPSRIVIGTYPDADPDGVEMLRSVFAGVDAPVLTVSTAEAELIKNGANAFLALRLSYVNEIAALCEEYDADVRPVLNAIGMDPRIGSSYLKPSFGFGGSCLPKELQTLAVAGLARGMVMHVTRAASEANAAHQLRFAERISTAIGGAEGRVVGMLGLAFKAGTDDVRLSPALGVARHLLDAGATIQAFDPEAGPNAKSELPALQLAPTAEAALRGADVAVIATEWPDFRQLDWAAVRDGMAAPLIVDGRRLLDPAAMRELGFRYEGLGLPSTPPEMQLAVRSAS